MDLGFKVQDLGCRVWDVGFGINYYLLVIRLEESIPIAAPHKVTNFIFVIQFP